MKTLSQTPEARELRIRRLAAGLGLTLSKSRQRWPLNYTLMRGDKWVGVYHDIDYLEKVLNEMKGEAK